MAIWLVHTGRKDALIFTIFNTVENGLLEVNR